MPWRPLCPASWLRPGAAVYIFSSRAFGCRPSDVLFMITFKPAAFWPPARTSGRQIMGRGSLFNPTWLRYSQWVQSARPSEWFWVFEGAERVLSAWQNPLTGNNNPDAGHTHSSRLAAPTDSVIGGAEFAWIAKTIRAACWSANGAGGGTPRRDKASSMGKVELDRCMGMSDLRMLTG